MTSNIFLNPSFYLVTDKKGNIEDNYTKQLTKKCNLGKVVNWKEPFYKIHQHSNLNELRYFPNLLKMPIFSSPQRESPDVKIELQEAFENNNTEDVKWDFCIRNLEFCITEVSNSSIGDPWKWYSVFQ